jgi:hypothetical protein
MSTHPSAAVAATSLRADAATDVASWEDDGGPTLARVQATQRLDWVGFLARFYPDAPRHDYEPLAAYVEYQKQREQT